MKCKRCGRSLTSAESIARGYGKKCFRIVQLNEQKEAQTIDMGVIADLLNRVRKLELDNTFMKHQLKHKVAVAGQRAEAIERIKQDANRPEQTVVKIEMTVIIKELKVIFNDEFDIHAILSKPENLNRPDIFETIELAN